METAERFCTYALDIKEIKLDKKITMLTLIATTLRSKNQHLVVLPRNSIANQVLLF